LEKEEKRLRKTKLQEELRQQMKEKNEMRLISQTERKEPHLTSGGPPLTNEQAQ